MAISGPNSRLSRSWWIEANEHNVAYFSNLEKRNYKISHITKLKTEDNGTTTDPGQILKEERLFYNKLYTLNRNCTDDFDNFFPTKQWYP